jgi:hypothetical protein
MTVIKSNDILMKQPIKPFRIMNKLSAFVPIMLVGLTAFAQEPSESIQPQSYPTTLEEIGVTPPPTPAVIPVAQDQQQSSSLGEYPTTHPMAITEVPVQPAAQESNTWQYESGSPAASSESIDDASSRAVKPAESQPHADAPPASVYQVSPGAASQKAEYVPDRTGPEQDDVSQTPGKLPVGQNSAESRDDAGTQVLPGKPPVSTSEQVPTRQPGSNR